MNLASIVFCFFFVAFSEVTKCRKLRLVNKKFEYRLVHVIQGLKRDFLRENQNVQFLIGGYPQNLSKKMRTTDRYIVLSDAFDTKYDRVEKHPYVLSDIEKFYAIEFKTRTRCPTWTIACPDSSKFVLSTDRGYRVIIDVDRIPPTCAGLPKKEKKTTVLKCLAPLVA